MANDPKDQVKASGKEVGGNATGKAKQLLTDLKTKIAALLGKTTQNKRGS